MRNIALLGSTGSIGTNTLEVIARNREEFNLIGIAAGENIRRLKEQVRAFSPGIVAVKHWEDAEALKKTFPGQRVVYGSGGLLELIADPRVDTMVSAIDGTTALKATLESIKRNHRICLANKETLVAAGELINEALEHSEAELIPIDSEQSAIFQCLMGRQPDVVDLRKMTQNKSFSGVQAPRRGEPIEVVRCVDKTGDGENIPSLSGSPCHGLFQKSPLAAGGIKSTVLGRRPQPVKDNDNSLQRVILTASGGPFSRKTRADFKNITVKEALAHPTWSMGAKITIDSATLMNKALEIIEAFYLFHLKKDQIDVIIHPQSIIHSMVEYIDSSIIAQLSVPDMKIPILYSLSYPRRISFPNQSLDFAALKKLEFFSVDRGTFTSIPMAYHVLEQGKNAGAVLNAANEVAVGYFLQEKISFEEIFAVVEDIFYHENFHPLRSLEDVNETIESIKQKTHEYVKRKL